MEQFENNEVEVNLKEIIGLLIRRSWIIILAGALLGIVAYFISSSYLTEMYQSTTQIYVMSKQDNTGSITYSDLQTSSQLTKDFMTLISSRPVTETVIAELGLDIKHGGLVDRITVSNPANTRILNITVEYDDPMLAKQIADAIRDAAAVHIKNVMNIDEINIVEEANIPESPSSPNVMMNTIIGTLLGMMIATFIILLIYMLDDTIKTPEDIEKHLGISVLSSIPIQKNLTAMKDKGEKTKKIRRKKDAKRQ